MIGELDIDEEYFTDWDEPIELLETESYRRDVPEGFTWSCCEKDGNDDGCRTDRHMPKVLGKKARIRE